MLFQRLIRIEVVLKQQSRAQLFGVDERLLIVAVLVDTHLDAHAIHIAAILLHLITCVVGGFVVRQMMVDLMIVDRIMPRNDAGFRIGILMDKGIVRGGVRPSGKVIRFMDDQILDFSDFPGPCPAALGQIIRVNRDVLNIGQARVRLRRTADRAVGKHACQK